MLKNKIERIFLRRANSQDRTAIEVLNIGITILKMAQHNEFLKKKCPFKPSVSTFLAAPCDKLSNAHKCKQSKAATQTS